MDRDRVKVLLKDILNDMFDNSSELQDREWVIGDDTINLMAEAALSVLLAVENVNNYIEENCE